MEIVKLEDVNITVKTLVMDGKKITKSIFDQIPFSVFMFYTNDTPVNFFGESYYDILGYRSDSVINGKFVAYSTKGIIKSNEVRKLLRFYDFRCCTPDDVSQIYYPMLYLDKDEKLKRSYISEYDLHKLKLKDLQIFI